MSIILDKIFFFELFKEEEGIKPRGGKKGDNDSVILLSVKSDLVKIRFNQHPIHLITN